MFAIQLTAVVDGGPGDVQPELASPPYQHIQSSLSLYILLVRSTVARTRGGDLNEV